MGLIGFGIDNSYRFFTYDGENGFAPATSVLFSDEGWWGGQRGLYIGDFAYVVSAVHLSAIDLNSFAVVTDLVTHGE